MGAVDRILEKGVIKPDFLKPEMRCGFYVDEKRKKIWAVALDLLFEFDRICRKYNLKYFIMGGSLIGAIRHNGFIPWDDDIDVAMLREDYEKFLKVGVNELKDPYMLQLPWTDEGYYYSFAKIRNKDTSAVCTTFRYAEFNQGIFMDIFPLDNCIKDDLEERFNMINKLNRENSTHMRMSNPYMSEADKKRVAELSGKSPMEIYNEIQEIATKYKYIETEYVNTAVFTAYKYDTLVYKKEWLNETIDKDFEGFLFPIPKGYDGALRVQYGDYMQLPPVEKRGTEHFDGVFDPDMPCDQMLKQLRNMDKN